MMKTMVVTAMDNYALLFVICWIAMFIIGVVVYIAGRMLVRRRKVWEDQRIEEMESSIIDLENRMAEWELDKLLVGEREDP